MTYADHVTVSSDCREGRVVLTVGSSIIELTKREARELATELAAEASYIEDSP